MIDGLASPPTSYPPNGIPIFFSKENGVPILAQNSVLYFVWNPQMDRNMSLFRSFLSNVYFIFKSRTTNSSTFNLLRLKVVHNLKSKLKH
jgi:hypothetical protein